MSRTRSDSSSSADSCGPGGLFSASAEGEFDDPAADVSREFLFANISINATKTASTATEKEQRRDHASLVGGTYFVNRVTFHYVYNKTTRIESYLEHTGEVPISWERHKRVLTCIGMCVLPWFWMGYGCRRIRVAASLAFPGLGAFFSDLYSNVLLEFLERSRLPLPELVVDEENGDDKLKSSFEPQENLNSLPHGHVRQESILVPLGGGKDSLVTLDMALDNGASVSLLYVADGIDEFEASWRLRRMAEMNPDVRLRIVKHEFIDDRFERSARSFLQPTGHPWAALVLFDAVLISQLYSIGRVQLGFERSADEGNGVYLHGKEINHQYDKSSVFLQRVKCFLPLLRVDYVGPYSDVAVESPLSCMWDLEVARIFCLKPSLRRYHDVFISCNESDGLQNWCMQCEKCAFVYLVFSAWLDASDVAQIFGGADMFASCDAVMERSFLSLVRRGAAKPYECVGTRWECQAAVELALRRRALSMASRDDGQHADCGHSAPADVPPVLAQMCAEVFYDALRDGATKNEDTPSITHVDLSAIARAAVEQDEQSIMDKWMNTQAMDTRV